jgi:anaerobic nitric oxide reductase flavorubredoxin
LPIYVNVVKIGGMSTIKQITSYISVIHSDICNHPLFEGYWSIPDGVTLNSYFVRGKKTALIDLTADWEEAVSLLKKQLAEIEGSGKIDYLILNHLEPDHTGYMQQFVAQNPDVEIISTTKGCALVKNFLKATECCPSLKLREVKTGDTLELCGVTLSFYEIPNVHWPETMCTFDAASGTLFSCDAFGGYGKTGNRIFDDEFTDEEREFYVSENLRYYATIVASFSMFVQKAVKTLTDAKLTIKTVAPSHGLIWRTHPETVINNYVKYAGYNTGGKCEHEICIICASMYGNTKKGAEAVARGIKKTDPSIKIDFLVIPETDESRVMAAAFRSAGVVIAAPTYEYKLFPAMVQILDLFNRKHYVGKKALRIGSWGWVGGGRKEYDALAEPLKWDQIEQYEWQGMPSNADLEILEARGVMLAEKLKE